MLALHRREGRKIAQQNALNRVPCLLVYAANLDETTRIKDVFAFEHFNAHLIPVTNKAYYLEALATTHAIDAIIIDERLADCDVGIAVQHAASKHPSAATFVLAGADFEDTIAGVQHLRAADFIPKAHLGALPYIVDSITRERRMTRLVRRALAESEQRFRQIAEHLEDVLWVCTADAAEVLYLSPAFENIWGLAVEAFYQDPALWRKFVHPDDRDRYDKAFASRGLQGKGFSIDYRIVRSDGTVRFVHDQGYPILDNQGAVYRLAGVIRDLTDERQLQEELRLSHRLEAVGQLAAGIAHEINTPAQFINDNLRFLKDSVADLLALVARLRAPDTNGAPAATQGDIDGACESAEPGYLRDEIPLAIDQSIDGIQRIASIVRAMKDFSHPGTATPEAANLNEIIKSAATVSRNEWKYVAEMVFELDPDLPAVTCRRQALSQVLVNLIVNAAQAIAPGAQADHKGTIRIATRQDGEWIELTVCDTGSGIPEAIRSRIFDQFFTTKEVGKGTGQGLAMAWTAIVDGHGGKIWVESTVGKGSTFTIRLPIEGPGGGHAAADAS